TVERAIDGVAALSPIDRCDDAAYVRARGREPDRPEVAEEVGRLREELVAAKALHAAGRYAAALEAMAGVVERAQAIPFRPLEAMLEREGKYDEAIEEQRRVLALLERRNKVDDPDVGQSLNSLGIVFDHLGRWDESVDHFQRAFAVWQRGLGPEHPRVAIALN